MQILRELDHCQTASRALVESGSLRQDEQRISRFHIDTHGVSPQRRVQCLQSPITNDLTSIPSERSNQCEEVLRRVLSSEGLPGLCGHRTLSLENQSPYPPPRPNATRCYSPTNYFIFPLPPKCALTQLVLLGAQPTPSMSYPAHHMANPPLTCGRSPNGSKALLKA